MILLRSLVAAAAAHPPASHSCRPQILYFPRSPWRLCVRRRASAIGQVCGFHFGLSSSQVKSSQVLVPPKSQPRTGHTRVRSVHSFRCSGGTGDRRPVLVCFDYLALVLASCRSFFLTDTPRASHRAQRTHLLDRRLHAIRLQVSPPGCPCNGCRRAGRSSDTVSSLRSDLRSVWIFDRSAANVQCII